MEIVIVAVHHGLVSSGMSDDLSAAGTLGGADLGHLAGGSTAALVVRKSYGTPLLARAAPNGRRAAVGMWSGVLGAVRNRARRPPLLLRDAQEGYRTVGDSSRRLRQRLGPACRDTQARVSEFRGNRVTFCNYIE